MVDREIVLLFSFTFNNSMVFEGFGCCILGTLLNLILNIAEFL